MRKRYPRIGWWKGLTVAEVYAQLEVFRAAEFDEKEVVFTHEVFLRRIRLTIISEQLPYSGTPLLVLGRACPLDIDQVINVDLLIGRAGEVEDHSPSCRFAFISLGSHRPIYCQVPDELILRPKR